MAFKCGSLVRNDSSSADLLSQVFKVYPPHVHSRPVQGTSRFATEMFVNFRDPNRASHDCTCDRCMLLLAKFYGENWDGCDGTSE